MQNALSPSFRASVCVSRIPMCALSFSAPLFLCAAPKILKTSRATKSLIHHNSVHFYAREVILPPFECSLQA
ncbi:hypothetical protein B9Z55_017835 [Caenorhabditis nigoni]|uniref:Uncharacterized protein n=1 Tax=Caenorhabditis nigoni TaxID=1611254 RepID=A0A2G5TB89_9PELO|nr:hypothetical protein B9Z55_017835 [Caenorhabditis nigoni]